jgi:hypothetical protein
MRACGAPSNLLMKHSQTGPRRGRSATFEGLTIERAGYRLRTFHGLSAHRGLATEPGVAARLGPQGFEHQRKPLWRLTAITGTRCRRNIGAELSTGQGRFAPGW